MLMKRRAAARKVVVATRAKARKQANRMHLPKAMPAAAVKRKRAESVDVTKVVLHRFVGQKATALL